MGIDLRGMLHQRAEAILSKLSRGKDCEEEVREFVQQAAQVSTVPDSLILGTLGNRATNVAACPKSLRCLLEARASPHIADPMTGAPVMHTACWQGSAEVVRALLDFKADMECPDPRMHTPPLNTALAAGSAKVCLELLNRNCNVQWKHSDGATALHVVVAWIASSHNSHLRTPPVGEEPRAVVAMCLHNGADPSQTEGMTVSANRSKGMTPLESFRREVSMSPWRNNEQFGAKFDETAKRIHTLLEQGERAMSLKADGNNFFKKSKYPDALKAYSEARAIWQKADIRGHHSAVLWSNEATCHRKLEDWVQCKAACEEGLTHYCAQNIRTKLSDCLRDATEQEEKAEALKASGEVVEKPKPAPVPRKPPSQLKGGFLGEEGPEKPFYPEGSKEGKVENPGPFICPFGQAQEAGFVDGVDGWKDKEKRRLQALDEELVRNGLMSPDLLDDPQSVDYINRFPPNADV